MTNDSRQHTVPLTVLGVGLALSAAIYYMYGGEIAYLTAYYTCNPSDREKYEELDRIEKAIQVMSAIVEDISEASPTLINKKIEELELDIDFILERLDSIRGSDSLKRRRKDLVRRTLAVTAQIERVIDVQDKSDDSEED